MRFNRYEVRDGYIRPAPGAKGEWYDPWEGFRASRSKQGRQDPPYQSLIALVEDLRTDHVLDWCAAHGLLGILLAQTDMVTLAPTAEGGGSLAQKRYFRRNTGWGKFSREQPVGAEPNWLPPGVLIQHLGTTKWLHEPFGETWARFFPDVPEGGREAYQYPMPVSDQFWGLYAEPVEEFVRAAVILRDALEGLGQGDERSKDIVHSLVFRTSPAIECTPDGGWRQFWVSTSLLGSLGMMVLLDLTEGRRLVRCGVCNGPFVTTSHAARYCSDRCRNTAQKRVQRAREKEKAHV